MIPDYESILSFIKDKKVCATWNKLNDVILENSELTRSILFYGKKYGWAVQYKKKNKTVVTLFPERYSFTVLFTFGKSELLIVESKLSKLSDIPKGIYFY